MSCGFAKYMLPFLDPEAGFDMLFNMAGIKTTPFSVHNFSRFGEYWNSYKHSMPDMRQDRDFQFSSAVTARTIIYGMTRVGNQLAYVTTSGAENQFLWILAIHASHQINSYEQVYFDDKLVAESYNDFAIKAPFSTCVTLGFHTGNQTEADSVMIAQSAGRWTAAHKLLGLAYTRIGLVYNEGVFPSGMPMIKVVVKGKSVYDPRSGFIAYSSNPALCILDYMMLDVTSGGMGCELDEIDMPSFITAANICDEQVYSLLPEPGTKVVTQPDGTLYPAARYTLNGEIKLDSTPTDILKSMLKSCAGDAVYSQGKWKIFAGGPQASVATIDESWLNGAITFQVNTDKNGKINTAKGVFTNSHDYWVDSEFPSVPVGASAPPSSTYWDLTQAPPYYDPVYNQTYQYVADYYVIFAEKIYMSKTTVPINTPPPNDTYWHLIEMYDAGTEYLSGHEVQRADCVYVSKIAVPKSNPYIAEDGGEVLTADLSLPFTITSSEAQRLAKIAVEKSRLGMTVNYPCNHKAFKFDIMDVIVVNNTLLGWEEMLFRVVGWSFSMTGGTVLSLAEYSPDIYNWVPGDTSFVTPPILTHLPDPWTVEPPTNLTVTETLYAGNVSSVIMSKATFSWTPGDEQSTIFYVYYDEVYYATVNDITIDFDNPTVELHKFGVKALNSLGAESAIITLEQMIYGKTAPPDTCDTFLINLQSDGTRQFTWSMATRPLDLAGFYIRYGIGLGIGWADLIPLHTGMLLASPYETNQLTAAEYTFAIVSVDTTGNESLPIYIEATLGNNRTGGIIYQETSATLGWGGIKTNCYIDEHNHLVASDQKDWASFPTDGTTWSTWTAWARNPYLTISYETDIIDIGTAVAFTTLFTVDSNGVNTNLINYSLDNITWSGWEAPSIVKARYIKLKVSTTVDSGVLAKINSLVLTLSGQRITETFEDLDTSTLTGDYRIGVGDIRIPIKKSYSVILKVSLILQSSGACGSWILEDKDTVIGPHVRILNGLKAMDDVIDIVIEGL